MTINILYHDIEIHDPENKYGAGDLLIISLKEIPQDIKDAVLALGPAEWGAEGPKTKEEHLSTFSLNLRLTEEHFGLPEKTEMHGLYCKDSERVIFKSGNSPNSALTTPLFEFLWNNLYNALSKTVK